MASIWERAKADGTRAFHVQVRMAEFPTRTASFPTRRAAERWAKTVEADMIEGRHFRNVEARRRTLADAIDRYVLEVLPRRRSGRCNLAFWKVQVGALKLAQITPAIIIEQRGKLLQQKFKRAKPESKRTTVKKSEKPNEFVRTGATANRYVADLSRLFTVARKEWHWVSHNPCDAVAKLRESTGRVRYLSQVERENLLKETVKDAQLHTFVVLALSTAARAGELWTLTWRDMDLEAGRMHLQVTKNAQPRTAWVHGEALRLLKEHAERAKKTDDDRVFTSSTGKRYRYDKPFTAACKTARIDDFTFHGLRHSAATYLAREGATEQQLRAIGGWKSTVVSRYVHLAAEDAKAMVEKMNDKILGAPKSK